MQCLRAVRACGHTRAGMGVLAWRRRPLSSGERRQQRRQQRCSTTDHGPGELHAAASAAMPLNPEYHRAFGFLTYQVWNVEVDIAMPAEAAWLGCHGSSLLLKTFLPSAPSPHASCPTNEYASSDLTGREKCRERAFCVPAEEARQI